jgi:hypothetical protein
MSTDNHDKMIEAFQSYFKWQDRFEFHDSDEAGIKVPQKKKLNSGTTRCPCLHFPKMKALQKATTNRLDIN